MPLDNVELATLHVPSSPQMRAHLAELTHPGGVELQPADTYEARDHSGFIVVTVNKSRMVTDVRIRARWQDRIRADAFPAALYNTYVTAVQRALAVEFTHRSVNPPGPAAPGEAYVDHAELSFEEWLARTRSRLDAIDEAYDEIRRRQRVAQPEVVEIRSPLGYLTMSVRDGGPIGIHGNPQALAIATDAVLSQDAQQLFGRADRGVGAGARPRPVHRGTDDTDDDYFSGFNVLRERGGNG